ncbi:MAG TPA: CopD family protein, partial [Micromonosporaceae bacterium]
WAFAGHPAASSVPPLTIIADVVHLASVSVWIGGLVMLLAFLLRKANARELSAILPVWSNWATLAITVLVLGGTAQALIQIGSFGALFHTTYGQLVILKVILLGVILLFAGGARRLVQRHAAAPALVTEAVPVGVGGGGTTITEDWGEDDAPSGGSDDDDYDDYDEDDGEEAVPDEPVGMGEPQVKRLRRSVLVELALAVVVLIASSILVQSSPVRNAAGVTTNSQGTISLTSSLYTLQVEFLPSGSGTDLHMFFYNPAGGAQPIKSLSIVATSTSGLTQNLGVAPISDSHWTSTAVLLPGKWTFAFTVRTTAIDEATVTTVQNIG